MKQCHRTPSPTMVPHPARMRCVLLQLLRVERRFTKRLLSYLEGSQPKQKPWSSRFGGENVDIVFKVSQA